MPGMDGKGPMGRGALSGRGQGRCILPLDPALAAQNPTGGAFPGRGNEGGGLRRMLRNCAEALCRFGGSGRGRGYGAQGNGGPGKGRRGRRADFGF
ncbi:hypothetical protein GTO89_07895 [Heliobacterium gestii]|uniref:Uncharacterized protein n=1 Tax=Heliomicrobium gestii TaxID=2699 RepID=A0A845LC84_HELGE|nr:DUF5320 domain-containing protein [Heliomicrobium gestii]MBM7866250.1 hypothetical protein [Heliomicrobium gestii]MZP42954.1 hypothetical protein [Heliomicrobium gestii]